MYEQHFHCPHCWQHISVILDPSVAEQQYIEDCEVCCNPLIFTIKFSSGELEEFNVGRANE